MAGVRLHERYGLPHQSVIGIDHALGYAALGNGSIDVKDAYSTDAKIEENDLVALEDDLQFFPAVRGRLSLSIVHRLPMQSVHWQARRNTRRKTHDSAERGGGAHEKLRAAPQICILQTAEVRRTLWVNLFRTSLRAGRCAISSWPDFRCCLP